LKDQPRSFIPAAGCDWLLPFYDPFLWILGGDAVRRPLIEQAALESGMRALDIGCGTGSLTLLVKKLQPGVEVVGLDPDPKAARVAKRKAERAGLAIALDEGFSDHLPYPDASFDRVFSSLMFHHLGTEEKSATLREVRRVLTPGGSLHLLDFGPPRGGLSRALAHVLHRAEHLRDNLEDRIPSLMGQAGLVQSEELGHRGTLIGSLSYYRALKPRG
jgi:ubiquinone/menaquinone biosynthesis C-methylase UbiE